MMTDEQRRFIGNHAKGYAFGLTGDRERIAGDSAKAVDLLCEMPDGLVCKISRMEYELSLLEQREEQHKSELFVWQVSTAFSFTALVVVCLCVVAGVL